MDVTAAIKALKTAADVYGKAKKIPEQKQILEGLAVIAVLQQDKFDLQEKVRELTSKLNETAEQLNSKDQLKFADNAYWVVQNNEWIDGLYCMNCFDNNLKHRLAEGNNGYYDCPHCNNSFLVNKQEHNNVETVSSAPEWPNFGI